MLKNIPCIILLSLTLFLVGCATQTPYQAVSEQNQYCFTNQMLEDNRAIVTFAGNSLTDQKTVETYMLYRAAELTLEKGFDHFNVVKEQTDADVTYVPTGFSYHPYYPNFYCRYRPYSPIGRARPFPRHTQWHSTFGPGNPYGRYGYGDWYYAPFFSEPWEVIKYEAEAEIIMGRGPKAQADTYFDARQVLANLKAHIVRPEPMPS